VSQSASGFFLGEYPNSWSFFDLASRKMEMSNLAFAVVRRVRLGAWPNHQMPIAVAELMSHPGLQRPADRPASVNETDGYVRVSSNGPGISEC
jgi:hypothetical protein